MLTVAIASEFHAYDGELYRYLLERVLGTPVQAWKSEIEFNGCKHVRKQAGLYLNAAAQQGVRHALVAIDNDGGSTHGLPHHPSHDSAQECANERGCRVCWLHSTIPTSWREDPYRSCVVVPVQTLETWLLIAKGHAFTEPSPEQRYHRPVLKKDCFGKPLPSSRDQKRMALDCLQHPEAIKRLSARPSFQAFVDQVNAWKG
ncbi:hypothetical protein [Corallococcus carmarthensis]|uniref:DUF4276 family protein n=1 Tax=Corallococcus carmarthensis TaxID=2316728 RepID=A0A3A8KFD1_9BACT|nr:hypothetical protein [Corallococcus carmarthensis]NOK23137.1 hypothetical protein [Corallococcus carmarthensis]RKH01172.1 hypothetical protein D7X32_21110 [Corallococcus carmarthensis]